MIYGRIQAIERSPPIRWKPIVPGYRVQTRGGLPSVDSVEQLQVEDRDSIPHALVAKTVCRFPVSDRSGVDGDKRTDAIEP
jgi:hypothetical protein